MFDTREKLIELLGDIQRDGNTFNDVEIHGVRIPDTVGNEEIADHLIANGITVQQWIPVEEEQPADGDVVLVYGKRGGIYTAEFYRRGEYYWFHKLNSKNHHCEPTHWMPLPNPPKEVR
jgi:hypothetical protein